MRHAQRLPGGELEYAVLFALCDRKKATAREIHSRVGQAQGLVYTTIAKVLDRLHAKDLISRRREGRAFTYQPRITRAALERARAREALRRLIGPSPAPAMATLVDAVESLSPDLLDELARQVEARRRSRRGS